MGGEFARFLDGKIAHPFRVERNLVRVDDRMRVLADATCIAFARDIAPTIAGFQESKVYVQGHTKEAIEEFIVEAFSSAVRILTRTAARPSENLKRQQDLPNHLGENRSDVLFSELILLSDEILKGLPNAVAHMADAEGMIYGGEPCGVTENLRKLAQIIVDLDKAAFLAARISKLELVASQSTIPHKDIADRLVSWDRMQLLQHCGLDSDSAEPHYDLGIPRFEDLYGPRRVNSNVYDGQSTTFSVNMAHVFSIFPNGGRGGLIPELAGSSARQRQIELERQGMRSEPAEPDYGRFRVAVLNEIFAHGTNDSRLLALPSTVENGLVTGPGYAARLVVTPIGGSEFRPLFDATLCSRSWFEHAVLRDLNEVPTINFLMSAGKGQALELEGSMSEAHVVAIRVSEESNPRQAVTISRTIGREQQLSPHLPGPTEGILDWAIRVLTLVQPIEVTVELPGNFDYLAQPPMRGNARLSPDTGILLANVV